MGIGVNGFLDAGYLLCGALACLAWKEERRKAALSWLALAAALHYSALLSSAMRCFVMGIFALQRRQARRLGIEQPRPGAIAFVQQFSSALLLHPHTHVLVPEGVFSADDKSFAGLPPPDDEEVEAL